MSVEIIVLASMVAQALSVRIVRLTLKIAWFFRVGIANLTKIYTKNFYFKKGICT